MRMSKRIIAWWITLFIILVVVVVTLCDYRSNYVKSDIEHYLKKAYPTRFRVEENNYRIYDQNGEFFTVTKATDKCCTWEGFDFCFLSITSVPDCMCAATFFLDYNPSVFAFQINCIYGVRPALQVFLEDDWWNVESAEAEYHPDGIPIGYSFSPQYTFSMLSRETNMPLPNGEYRLVIDLSPYKAVYFLNFELNLNNNPIPMSVNHSWPVAAYPEAWNYLRNNFGDFIQASDKGICEAFYREKTQHGERHISLDSFLVVMDMNYPDESTDISMQFAALEKRLGGAPARIGTVDIDNPKPDQKKAKEELGDYFVKIGQYGYTAAFRIVNNTGEYQIQRKNVDGYYTDTYLEVYLDGHWWLIPRMEDSTLMFFDYEEGQNSDYCLLYSLWTGKQLSGGHYRYTVLFENQNCETICMHAEFNL